MPVLRSLKYAICQTPKIDIADNQVFSRFTCQTFFLVGL